jgi:hypothetical protein
MLAPEAPWMVKRDGKSKSHLPRQTLGLDEQLDMYAAII